MRLPRVQDGIKIGLWFEAIRHGNLDMELAKQIIDDCRRELVSLVRGSGRMKNSILKELNSESSGKNSDHILLGLDKKSNLVHLNNSERTRHMYVLGSSGTGKSYFLQSLAQQDIDQGNGICVIDPHGELYNNLLAYCAGKDELRKRVVLFNPSDFQSHVVGFNPLAKNGYHEDISLKVDRFIDAIKRVMSQDSETQPQLEQTLRNALIPLIKGGHSLLDIQDFFDFKNAKRAVQMAEPVGGSVLTFWQNFAKMQIRERLTTIGSTQRRIEKFIHNEAIRLSLGQSKRTLDFRDIIENRKILLVNLGLQGNRISEDNAHLLGTLLVHAIHSYGMTRSRESAIKRPFYLYLDEFQNFVTSDIEKIITGGRKFGLHLILANQHLSQIEDEKIRDAALSAHIQVVFRVLYRSAVVQAENLGTYFDLNEVKYWDQQTSFEPYLELRTTHSHSNANTFGSSDANGQSSGFGSSDGSSCGGKFMANYTESQKNSSQHGQTATHTSNRSTSATDSVNETWVTNHKKRVDYSPRFYPLAEHYYLFTSALVNQPQRMATVKIGEQPPFQIRTQDVAESKPNPKFKKLVYWSHGCYTPLEKAQKVIAGFSGQPESKPPQTPKADPESPFN